MRHISDMTIPVPVSHQGQRVMVEYHSHCCSLVAVLGEEQLKLQSQCWEKEFEWGPGCQKIRNDEQLRTRPEEIRDNRKQGHVKLQNPSADLIVQSNFT